MLFIAQLEADKLAGILTDPSEDETQAEGALLTR